MLKHCLAVEATPQQPWHCQAGETPKGQEGHRSEHNPLWELLDKQPLPQPWGITGGVLTGFQQLLGTAWMWHSKAAMQSGGISPVCPWLHLQSQMSLEELDTQCGVGVLG